VRNRGAWQVFALVSAVLLVGASCTGGDADRTNGRRSPGVASPSRSIPCLGCTDSGTYRTAIQEFGFTANFDPTGETWRPVLGLYSELLLRSLMTFRHVGGMAGTVPVPDLAREAPKVSANDLTYTFTLKRGVKFGPPLDRDVTSRDVEYAFERINAASLASPFRPYFAGVIEGMTGRANQIAPVSGIETPDHRTIVFHLTRPVGDLPYLLAMPATAPVPVEVAGCFTEPGEYGRYLIASGPYMIGGEESLDTSTCHTMKPIRGFNPKRRLTLVRNPDYDATTDSSAIRENNIEGLHVAVVSNADRIYPSIEAGKLDGSWGPIAPRPPHGVTGVTQERGFHSDPDGETRYLNMNLLVPPFDDVAVRRAVNDAIDKSALQQAWGGPSTGDIATHVMPPHPARLRGSRVRPPRDAEPRRRHSTGEGGDGEVQV
jgi:peptide/nickel transport system substrate-binding protein